MENKVLKFIEFLKENGYEGHTYKGSQPSNKFYYDVNGYIDGLYFNIVLRHGYVSGFEIIHSHNSECIELIEWLLKEFKIIK